MNKPNNNRVDRGANKKRGNAPAESMAEIRAKKARQYGIKPKTKAMIDDMLDNPKMTQREAYMKHHKTTNLNTVDRALNRTMKKPSVIGYRDAALKKAKRRIVTLVDSTNESISLKASQDIIDRNEGKAIQKNENTSRTVHVSLDLTGLKLGNHYLAPRTPETLTS